MTDRDFNSLLETIEFGLKDRYPPSTETSASYISPFDPALEALHDLRTRIEKVEALPEKWRDDPPGWSSSFTRGVRDAQKKACADELTQALQGGGE